MAHRIEFLQSKLSDLAGSIFFEFNIPRMGRRIDVVLVIGGGIRNRVKRWQKTSIVQRLIRFGITDSTEEFSPGESRRFQSFRFLIATEATECPTVELLPDADKLYRPVVMIQQAFEPR